MTFTLFKKLIIVGLTLGTAWAVRGQFGHEQGAAWAGGIASLAILVIARRPDWNANLFGITLAGAIGWGLGGMMSYGLLVGHYGHSSDLGQATYGQTMLFVVGGLYGFLGGGLFSLALGHSSENPVPWFRLSLGMIAGGLVCYFLIIHQLNWRMTAPRSEAWAICLGMALTLAGYLAKTRRTAPLRVAGFTALGAGFGFAIGNIIHAFGLKSGIAFNFWNVMEYSLGFCGGIGLAWSVFTTRWPKNPTPTQSKNQSRLQFLAFLFLALAIPLRVWTASFSPEKLKPGPILPEIIRTSTFIAMFAAAFLGMWRFNFLKNPRAEIHHSDWDANLFFKSYFLFYIFLSLWVTGALFSTDRVEQYLYPINFVLILFLLRRP